MCFVAPFAVRHATGGWQPSGSAIVPIEAHAPQGELSQESMLRMRCVLRAVGMCSAPCRTSVEREAYVVIYAGAIVHGGSRPV